MTVYVVKVRTAEGWEIKDSMYDQRDAAKLARWLREQGHEVEITSYED
jgi:hypothetical protein